MSLPAVLLGLVLNIIAPALLPELASAQSAPAGDAASQVNQSVDPTRTAGIQSHPTVVEFIANAIKNSEGATAITFGGELLGAGYVPLRVVDWPLASILDAGVGVAGGQHLVDGVAAVRINLPQIANGIFGTSWFVKHTHGLELPTLFIGPCAKVELPVAHWTFKKDLLFLVGIPLGSLAR